MDDYTTWICELYVMLDASQMESVFGYGETIAEARVDATTSAEAMFFDQQCKNMDIVKEVVCRG